MFLPQLGFFNSDAWVLQTVQDFQIEYFKYPTQLVHQRPLSFSREQRDLIDKEVSDLLRKRAVVSHLDPSSSGFPQQYLLSGETGWGYRPVINLKDFNEWVQDGGYPPPQGSSPNRRLDGPSGPQGCIPHNPDFSP